MGLRVESSLWGDGRVLWSGLFDINHGAGFALNYYGFTISMMVSALALALTTKGEHAHLCLLCLRVTVSI